MHFLGSTSTRVLIPLLCSFITPFQGGLTEWRPASSSRVWDDAALATLEVPLAEVKASPAHVSAEFYYKIPVRPIHKSYPIYHPDREPPGYWAWLQEQEPEELWDVSKLKTREAWIRAGELVFDAPIGVGSSFKVSQVRDPAWYALNLIPLAKDGTMPFSRYVIRRKGQVEVGGGACLMCHTRVMPDGSVLKGAQGNFPTERIIANNLRSQAASAREKEKYLESIRLGQRIFFSVPWLEPDPIAPVDRMSTEELAAAYEAIPPGVGTRVNLSVFFPAQVPDLIGIQDRRHLERTGMVRQRSVEDLLRYAALVQGANSFDRFGGFRLMERLPEPETVRRYSDDQLRALGMFLYSLRPPENPNKMDALARRGKQVFEKEGCALCHMPPLYTNNKLTPAEGFEVPKAHLSMFGIHPESVGTDPGLALKTRKGTGYYKVPSLKGVWYRGPFEHSGSVATLEDWFDPNRLRGDYVPTGFRGVSVERRAVRGHPFGLGLSEPDRKALIAFLRTL